MAKKDRFEERTTYISRLDLSKALEIYENASIYEIHDGDTIFEEKVEPSTNYKQMFERHGITWTKQTPLRQVNSKQTSLAGVPVKVSSHGKKIEFISDTKDQANQNYSIVEDALDALGIEIIEERTRKCGKETCLLSRTPLKQELPGDIIGICL